MNRNDKNKHLTIVVAALTRDRPNMLKDLLNSFGRMDVPSRSTVHFLIVENSDQDTSRSIVESSVVQNGLKISYVMEPELGIPFARNRAAREAIKLTADLLAFVDDDEEVAEDWLSRLVDGYRNSDALLLGAPLRMRPLPSASLSWSQRLMQRSLADRYRRKEQRAARLADLNGTAGVTIVTNNWIAETQLFSEYDLWFDEEMRFTGGTDAKFYAEALKRGIPTGWVSDAYVYETVPAERLSFTYQFCRGRDQSNTNFRRRYATGERSKALGLFSVALRCFFMVPLVLSLPFVAGRTYVDVARNAGWITGRITALFGKRSQLYSKTTGS